jgi:uncharacterized protein
VATVPRRRAGAAATVLVFAACLFVLGAADLKIPASPDRWVTDTAGFLTPATARELDQKLEAYEKETGHQILVYIGKTTDGYPIEEFATRAFQAWKVGRKGLDDGLVLFVMAKDKKIRIEVGYGLEPVVPDIIAGRIINDIMVPRIRDGDQDGAVREAVAAILQTISGNPPAAAPAEQPESPAPGVTQYHTLKTIAIIIGAVFFLILFITNPTLALWLLFSLMGGGRGGGGGGGGFRGGGGRSGGGGASGGW